MKRRRFIMSTVAGAAFPMIGKTAEQKTNILFIHMEDMGCQIPAYGDNTQPTPALSRLAQEGMVFERVWVTAPSCAPSRGSIFTGLYPHQNGIWAFDKTHGFHYRDGIPTFVKMFKEAGFATGISYKTGVEPGTAVPFDRKYSYNKNALGKDPGTFQVSNCVDGFEHFLKSQVKKGQPFYFQAQTNDTHEDWSPNFEPIRGEKSKLGFKPVDPAKVKPLPQWGDVEMTDKVRAYLATYYGAIQRVDWFVDQVLGLLKQYGHADNTLVIFSADHGPSGLYRGKTTSYEFGLHVPFIVKWPGVVKPNTRSEALVSFVDLMPTFLEVAGLPRPGYLPGKSIVPVLTGERPAGDRKLLFSAFNAHTTGEHLYWPARAVTDGRFKLIHNLLGDGKRVRPGDNGSNFAVRAMVQGTPVWEHSAAPPAFELFDLQRDPGELKNLAGSPEYKKIEAELKAGLTAWRGKVMDPFVDPAVLKDFTEEYYQHCKVWVAQRDKMGKKGMEKAKWHLDKERWIPPWDPNRLVVPSAPAKRTALPKKAPQTDSPPNDWFRKLDADNDGKLTQDEFVKNSRIVAEQKGRTTDDQKQVRKFKRMDADQDGMVSWPEMKAAK